MIRNLTVSAALAAGIIAASAGTASANPIDDNPNPGGGTVGLDCVYMDGANPPEYCLPQYTPTRVITPPDRFRNPLPPLWHDLTSWWPW